MSMDTIFCIVFGLLVSSCFIAMTVTEYRKANRTAPYGKVFVKEFVDMVDDIKYALVHNSLSCITTPVNRYSFRVSVKEEVPYDGLEYEITPVYKSYAIYVDDEIVCRVHKIRHCYTDHHFIEFSSKRERDEVIEIVKSVYTVAKDINYESMRKFISKSNSKSFYSEVSDGNK